MTDEPWILSEGRGRTHAALRLGAARAAGAFRALGVREGDAVALLLGSGLPFLEASLGATLAGAHPVPVDVRLAPDDVGCILRDCSARLRRAGPHHGPGHRPEDQRARQAARRSAAGVGALRTFSPGVPFRAPVV